MMTRRSLLLLLLLVLGVGVGAWLVFRPGADPDAVPPPPAHVTEQRDLFALLVGCTEYPGLKETTDPTYYEEHVRLRGPANDAALMRSVLRDYLGVPEAHIRVLTGWPDDPAARPTRANILEHLERLAREVPREARVLFMFAGHGSQQPDQAGGEEGDRMDEILLPADTRPWDPALKATPNVITDDEIRAHLLALRDAGATVWAVFDSCHSGTMMRGSADAPEVSDIEPGEVRTRSLMPDVLGIPSQPHSVGSRGGPTRVGGFMDQSGPSLKGIASFYGAHSWEEAPELNLPRARGAKDRKPHGLLSYQVARALQFHGGGQTLAEIFQHVRTSYAAMKWDGASPLSEGDLGLRVRPGQGGSVLLLRREGGRLVVDSGSLRDLTVGSVLEVFRPGGFGEPTARLGKVRLAEVEPVRSVCGSIEGGPDVDTIPDAAPARLVELAAGGAPLCLALLDAAGVPLTEERVARFREAHFTNATARARFPCDDSGRATWALREVVLGKDGVQRLALEPLDPTTGFAMLETPTGELLATLERVQHAESRRRMASDPALATLPAGVVVEAFVQRFGSDTREPLTPGVDVTPGDSLCVRLTNGSGREVDVAVKNIDAAQVESHVWPLAEPCRRLHADEKDPVEVWLTLNDDGVGRESLIVVVALRDRGAAPLDVGGLSGPAVQAAPEAAAQRQGEHALLATLAPEGGQSRGGDDTPAAAVAIRELTWTTSWGRMGIPSARIREMVALDPPVGNLTSAPRTGPAPGAKNSWNAATIVRGDEQRADILLLSGTGEFPEEGAMALLVDANGDAGMQTIEPAEAARRAAAGQLPVELWIVLEPTHSWAAYPRHPGDRALGLVVLRGPGSLQGQATERFVLRGEAWEAETTHGGWLTSSLVPFNENPGLGRKRIVAALRGLLRAR